MLLISELRRIGNMPEHTAAAAAAHRTVRFHPGRATAHNLLNFPKAMGLVEPSESARASSRPRQMPGQIPPPFVMADAASFMGHISDRKIDDLVFLQHNATLSWQAGKAGRTCFFQILWYTRTVLF